MFPWSRKKDAKYYLEQAGLNLEKAVQKGVSSLADGIGGKKNKSWMDEFGDFIDKSCDTISNDFTSIKKSFKTKSSNPTTTYTLRSSSFWNQANDIASSTIIRSTISSSAPDVPPKEESNFLLYLGVGSVLGLGVIGALRKSESSVVIALLLIGGALTAYGYASTTENSDTNDTENRFRPR